MTYKTPGGALDYYPCRYGTSKLLMRGPRRRLNEDYVAFIGGTETYGRFLAKPYPALFETATGICAVNLGCVNAGIDVYLADPTVLEICANAKVTVIQLMGAQNMSNRFYRVHPRRNDRFLGASAMLQGIYRDIDFTEFSFTRHMLRTLERASPEKFEMVRNELKAAWTARIRQLIEAIGGRIVLLWLADQGPEDAHRFQVARTDPLFIDREMLRAAARQADRTVQIVATPDEIAAGRGEMIYTPMERPAVEEMLGPVVHRRAAEALAQVVPGLAADTGGGTKTGMGARGDPNRPPPGPVVRPVRPVRRA